MTATVSYLREIHLRKLKSAVEGNLDLYLSEDSDWAAFFEGEDFLRRSSIPMAEDLASRIRMPDNNSKMDAENCVVVYESLKDLTLQQAADERVWAHLTHFELRDYVRRRWPLDANNREKAANLARAHYFVSGMRGFYRDNAVSRLWWMGWIASRCSHFGLERTLEILLHQTDVRANLLERSSLAMSEEIFNAVMKRLGESYDGDKRLFERKTFREWMKRLNRTGGRVVLNALGPEGLDGLVTAAQEGGSA